MRADDRCSPRACNDLETPCLCSRIERALEVIERHGWTRQGLSQTARVLESIARNSTPTGQARTDQITNVVRMTPFRPTVPMSLSEAVD